MTCSYTCKRTNIVPKKINMCKKDGCRRIKRVGLVIVSKGVGLSYRFNPREKP